MSIEAMVWVKKYAPTNNTTEMCILYALADHADDEGKGCWPYYDNLADASRCSVATVKRHIKELESRGLISRGDQRHVSYYPKYRRPIVWDLNLLMKRETPKKGKEARYQDDPSLDRGINGDKVRYQPEQSEVPTATKRGVTGDTGNRPLTSIQPSVNLSSSVDEPRLATAFKEFWDHYPRKIARIKAEEKFKEKAEEVGADVLINAVKNYAAECIRYETEKKFIPYPATWIYQNRWKDSLTVSKTSVKKSEPAPEFDMSEIVSLIESGEHHV